MPKEKASDTESPEVVVRPIFRRGAELIGVPEIQMVSPPGLKLMETVSHTRPAVDLKAASKVWLLSGPGGGGKTLAARWMMWRMAERGQSAMLTALDPTNRSLATWFDNVHQPESNDGAHTARFLREFFEFLIENPQHAIVDLGAGDTALQRTIGDVGGLQSALEETLGLVACYFLTPRVDDLGILQTIERTGFQPRATLLILNTGRADPTRPLDEQFTMITRHSIFRAAVDRGAAVLWMPALDSGVMQEVEAKRLDFGMARDGLVPAGAAFPPVGGLRRHMVTNWLAQMETAFAPVAGWLP
jgi:hypothetical protein